MTVDVTAVSESALWERLRERREVLRVITENSEDDVRDEIDEIMFLLSKPEGTPPFVGESGEVPAPMVRPVQYEVSCLSENDPARRHYTLRVVHKGSEKWAVTDGPLSLGAGGEWDYERGEGPEWLKEHRFDLATALDLARKHAPEVELNDQTVRDVLARRRKQQ